LKEIRLTLKEWRLARQKTIADMAKACGVHPNTYMAWERDPEGISVRYAKIIARVLELTVNDIFFK